MRQQHINFFAFLAARLGDAAAGGITRSKVISC